MGVERKLEEARHMLNAWGIGGKYAESRLTELGPIGKELSDLFKSKKGMDKLTSDLQLGVSYYLHGDGALTLAMVFTGLVGFRGFSVRAIHLSQLSDFLDSFNSDEIEDLSTCDLLAVHSFYEAKAEEPPLSSRSRFRVENFLHNRAVSDRSVVLVGSGSITLLGNWWSESLTNLVTGSGFIHKEVKAKSFT